MNDFDEQLSYKIINLKLLVSKRIDEVLSRRSSHLYSPQKKYQLKTILGWFKKH
jgi:hypothetical protein